MQLSVEHKNETVVVAPVGRIDHASADAFATALQPHLERSLTDGALLVLDMNGVDYISSVGLRALMLAGKEAEARSGRIAIARLTPLVREVFAISRFDLLFDVYESIEEAVAARGARG